ncbi:hypothetical protein ACFP3U_37070 [Kitasatospora misakiensis]|uniref:Uncharacterized protein n=1 Tax=Kitasatospora misakiensis TaxID=67330 RepID=A0ABW0XD89_9ACTN|nr:hypothetical protein [Streptomyces aculeolatus]
MFETTTTAWPEGVIARYLTVGGATVDLTHRLTVHKHPEPFATRASCSACPASNEFSHWFRSGWSSDKEERDEEKANEHAREWAQSHAEVCRALPKPEGV